MGLGVRAAPFTYVAHALAVAAAVMVLVWAIHFRGGLAIEATNKNLIFNVHPVLMLIGYIIIGSEAIMVYKVFPTLNHDTAKLIHLILHGIALVLGAVGIYFAFKNHNESGIANLYSLHSWLGIGTITLYGIQWIFGFVTFFFPGAAPNFRRNLLPWHILFGLFVYILALANAELGFLEKLTFLESSGLDKYGTEAFLVNFTALVVVLFGASVVVAAVAPARLEEPQGYAPIPEN
ncbi:ascorbate-specific transmembrane electron transporter 2 [Panicum miliaceum]|uniref:Ascorbate-specific transmembrane electron transporter 2 n=1 Tax=Panicum miliaceum TaxID=4540 RepID=A0A3L6QJ20_PANMI|nr:ascorbate-specific transmembrane electron transporter 2 [Panicum miliaceum]